MKIESIQQAMVMLNIPPVTSIHTIGGRRFVSQGYVSDVADGIFNLFGQRLTPAQQHADELLETVKTLTSITGGSIQNHGAAQRLIRKIEPPVVPPTLEEAIGLLRHIQLTGGLQKQTLEAFLARVPK